jgi:hypothetical protein
MKIASFIKSLANLMGGGAVTDNEQQIPLWVAIFMCVLGLGVIALVVIFAWTKLFG